jgi:putative transposase
MARIFLSCVQQLKCLCEAEWACSPGFSTMGELLRDGLQFLRTISRSRAALSAEILFLRKQLAYYQDHRIRPRRLRDASPLCLLFWSRLFDWPAALVVVKTSTFLRWHSKGFKWYWRWKSRGGRPPLPKEIRQLIARMVRENVTWGEERIADELSLKLGIYVSQRTVRKYWPQQPGIGSGRRRTTSQPWKTFVRNHAQGIVACDFLGW